MKETPNEAVSPDKQYRIDVLNLYKLYHPDVLVQSGLKGVEAEAIVRILSDCLEQTGKTGPYTPDIWPRRSTYAHEDIILVRPLPSGGSEYATKPIRVPSSPREFVRILKEFVDTGLLPDGSKAQERKAPEKKEPTPEEAVREQMSKASSIKQLQAIAKTLDDGMAEFTLESEPRTPTFSPRMYNTLRFETLPARASEFLTAQISGALNAKKLEEVFETVLTSELFRDAREPRQLSEAGESLLRSIFTRAEAVLMKAIGGAKNAQRLDTLRTEVERFFGCSIDEIKIYERLGTKGRLSSSDRAKMSYDQQQRYARGERPTIRGPLSDQLLEDITRGGAPMSSGISQFSTRDMVARFQSYPLTSLFSPRFTTFGQEMVMTLAAKIADRRLELQKVR